LAASINANEDLNRATDVMAFNRYPGWYFGTPEDWGRVLDKLRTDLPGRAIGISEYGAGANVSQHGEKLTQPKPGGNWHPEEWQSHVHEAALKALEARPWLWCTFIWNMYDFASDARNEGGLPGLNDKGLVTYDRKIRKDAFYWYKANWSNDPFVHINSRRFTPRRPGPVTVRVYSNLGTVELTVNGKSAGSKTSTDHIFEWDGVQLGEGTNTVKAAAQAPAREVTDSCVWVGKDEAPEELGAPPAKAP
jgi:beta-galactosidase